MVILKSQLLRRKRTALLVKNFKLHFFSQFGLVERDITAFNTLRLFKLCDFLTSSLLNGWYIRLRLEGFGYKFKIFKGKIRIYLGHSSNIDFLLPSSVLVFKDKKRKQHLVLYSLDLQILKRTVLRLKGLRPLNCYKYLGVLYVNQKEKQPIKPGKQQYK